MPHAKILFFALMAVTIATEITGDYLLKKWSIDNTGWLFAGGLVMYLIGTACWAWSLKYETLSQAIVVFVILTLLGGVCVGSFFFGEKLTLVNKLGVALAIASIIMVEV